MAHATVARGPIEVARAESLANSLRGTVAKLREAADALDGIAARVEDGCPGSVLRTPYAREVERAHNVTGGTDLNMGSLLEYAVLAELARAQGV
jgi:hypothetical protein